jgi:beta-phosphoglucomutase-like phosphatase (HAD superfamily)/dTDP-glucose pyrophosphorylase
MVKLIIFDMDGVLVEAKQIHFDALNQALREIGRSEKYVISETEHLSIYDGLKTSQKLELLTQNKGLHPNTYESVWDRKQQLTLDAISKIKPNLTLQSVFSALVEDGYKLSVCSNSIRKTVLTVLSKLGIIEFIDLILSNEDVKNSKPHPEMYWTAMSILSILPEETLIIEDSPHGLLAAHRSCAHTMRVRNPHDVTYTKIALKLFEIENGIDIITNKWKDEKLNILIPMAGAGSRFEQAGYTFPKPLIDINGKPMIQVVVENINIDANYIYIVQKKHHEKYNLDTLLNLITPNCKIVEVDGITEGAACTALQAKKYINNDAPLFFANSDQFVEWDSNEFMYKMQETNADGGIVTFKATHPKWSFVKLDKNGLVTEVAEKNPISDNATVGFYYWKQGSDFIKYAEQMIVNNIRVNNEFYVCPVFNEAINDNKDILAFNIKKMWGLGTPEDLRYFIENKK